MSPQGMNEDICFDNPPSDPNIIPENSASASGYGKQDSGR